MSCLNLIVADDHVVLRQALCEMLEGKGRYKIIAQASDGEELLKLLSSHRPDVIIMDVAMPNLDGVGTLRRMTEQAQVYPVLVLSADAREKNIRDALKAGAKGFLPKNASIEELEFAISSIMGGKTYLSPSVTNKLMGSGSSESVLDNPLSVLTPRELEILKHLAEGKPNREIGKLLHISTRTVDTHRSNILKKLKVKTNAELVRMSISNGLVEI